MATESKKQDATEDQDDDLKGINVVIEPEEPEEKAAPADKKGSEKKEEDPDSERSAKDDGDDQDKEGESDNLNEEERAALRKKRADERALRRQRAKEREEARERELEELRRTVQELSVRTLTHEQRSQQSDFQRIEAGIESSIREMEEAKGLIAKAATENNGQALAEAQEAYYEARQRAEYLSRLKHGIVARSREDKQQPKVDPDVARHARDWMSKNTWYDPSRGDEDSMIALAIDDALAKEGRNPATKEYWDEFNKRIAKRLPHRVTKEGSRDDLDDDLDDTQSPTSGTGRERAPAGKTTYRLSAARVAAMKEAGIWDDEKARAKAIKRYMEYDKAQQQKGAQK